MCLVSESVVSVIYDGPRTTLVVIIFYPGQCGRECKTNSSPQERRMRLVTFRDSYCVYRMHAFGIRVILPLCFYMCGMIGGFTVPSTAWSKMQCFYLTGVNLNAICNLSNDSYPVRTTEY